MRKLVRKKGGWWRGREYKKLEEWTEGWKSGSQHVISEHVV